MIELEADYLEQVNPFEMFEVVEPKEKPLVGGMVTVVRYFNLVESAPITIKVDNLTEYLEDVPIENGEVLFCYWVGTRPDDPTVKSRCTIITYGYTADGYRRVPLHRLAK